MAAVLACAGAAVACDGGGEAPAIHHRVAIRALAFQPAMLVVAPGDTITWTNEDVVPHIVTGADGWTSEELDWTEAFTFVVPRGTASLSYLCSYHPVMVGRIEIDRGTRLPR